MVLLSNHENHLQTIFLPKNIAYCVCITLYFISIIPKLVSCVFLAQTFIKLMKIVEKNVYLLMFELILTKAIPAIDYPIPDCAYITEDVNDILAAAQLNTHAFVHQQGANVAVSIKQKSPKIQRPVVSRGSMEEEWHTFLQGWGLFKQGTDIPRAQISNQLWQCCHKDLEKDLFKDITNVSDTDEHALLAAIKRLAVISAAASVRKTELLTMRQDHGQPIRSFAANVKGKAQVCAFAKECTNDNCTQIVDYMENIVKYVVILVLRMRK